MILSSLSPPRLARSSARHPWRTILAWIIVVAAITVLSGAFGAPTDNSSNANFTVLHESAQGDELIKDHFAEDQRAMENVVVSSETLTVDDPAFREVVEATFQNLEPWRDDFASITNFYDAEAAGAPEAASLVSADRHSLR